jgi:hypothetical protein
MPLASLDATYRQLDEVLARQVGENAPPEVWQTVTSTDGRYPISTEHRRSPVACNADAEHETDHSDSQIEAPTSANRLPGVTWS